MKKLTCEMCGSTDIIKQDGFFICQVCGMKYSAEEAKKMMIEGTVDVQGTVKVDNSSFVEKYLANARRAKSKEDWEETEKYYNMVEQNDPTNIEAIFYSAYGKAMLTLIETDIYKRKSAFKVLKNCVSIIDDNYDYEDDKEIYIVEQINDDIFKMVNSSYVYNQIKNGYGIITSDDKSRTELLFGELFLALIESLEHIIDGYGEEKKENKIKLLKLVLSDKEYLLKSNLWIIDKKEIKEEINNCYQKIHILDPTYQVPESKSETSEISPEKAKIIKKMCYFFMVFYSICSIIFTVISLLFDSDEFLSYIIGFILLGTIILFLLNKKYKITINQKFILITLAIHIISIILICIL